MTTGIVVSSVNRPAVLHEAVNGIARQTISPGAIILSLCDAHSVLDETARLPLVRVVQGSKGLTAQRNTGFQALPPATKYVLFLDDDIELAPNYLESMQQLLDRNPTIAVASGVIAKDGLQLARVLTREEAVAAVLNHRRESRIETVEGASGCNMFVRRSLLDTVRFDERLPLNAWLEDYDFSARCRAYGDVVWNLETCVAHMGVRRVAREQGFLVGYTQIANPHYLWRKGVISSVGRLLGSFWLPALRVSLKGTLRPKPPWSETCDYKGRLRGHLRALLHAASFRLKPERILELAGQPEPTDSANPRLVSD